MHDSTPYITYLYTIKKWKKDDLFFLGILSIATAILLYVRVYIYLRALYFPFVISRFDSLLDITIGVLIFIVSLLSLTINYYVDADTESMEQALNLAFFGAIYLLISIGSFLESTSLFALFTEFSNAGNETYTALDLILMILILTLLVSAIAPVKITSFIKSALSGATRKRPSLIYTVYFFLVISLLIKLSLQQLSFQQFLFILFIFLGFFLAYSGFASIYIYSKIKNSDFIITT